MSKINYAKDIKIENMHLKYNSFSEYTDIIKPYLIELANKYTRSKPSTIKQECIDYFTHNYYNKTDKLSIYSDYKENSEREINVDGTVITIIFNIDNYERLLMSDCISYVLVDLNNFTHDISIISKYITMKYDYHINLYYFILGKIWIYFGTTALIKNTLIDSSVYYPDLQMELNRYSIYLRYLYSKIYYYAIDKTLSKKEIMNKILNDVEIQNIINIVGKLK